MDKKSILFIVVLTAAFFIVNNFLFPPAEIPPKPLIETPKLEQKKSESPRDRETLYVIENETQQIVISNVGGAIAEINLPFKSKNNPASVVLPINFDETFEESYPKDDLFPSKPYTSAAGSNLTPKTGGYYPLLRRAAPPEFFALATTSEDPETAQTLYSVKRLDKNLIELEGRTKQGTITKTISLPADAQKAPYCFDVSISIDGDASALSLGSGVPEVELISGSPSPTLKYRFTRNKKAVVDQLSLPKTTEDFEAATPDWICNSNGFFAMILDPLSEIPIGFSTSHVSGEMAPTRLSQIDAQYDRYPASKYPGYEMGLPLSSVTKLRIYAGPLTKEVLKTVDATFTDSASGYNPDYISCISFHGWFSFISEPFAKFLFFLMEIFHFITRSWGISIILLTVALRLMLYPLNAWSIKSTTKMQQVSPKIAQIQEKHKKDPKKAQAEIMALYRQQGVNPLGGCLPLLIQMPFLIGMFDLLKSTFELRGASFIPGWITNLTAPDVVFSWGYPIWFFGTSFHLLPIILGIVMFWQQQMSSNLPKDPKQWTDQQRQQRFMGNIMAVVFTVLFYHFPSGLNLYWLSSMLLGILQQWWMTKKNAGVGNISVLPRK